MRGGRRTLAFELGLLAVTVGAMVHLFSSPVVESWLESPWSLGDLPEPVLVVVVGDAARLERVRAAIPDERIRTESAGAFAVAGGRIIAESFDAAGPVLTDAGWVDRKVEIVAPGRERAEAGSTAAPDRYAELLAKPTLTLAEARSALRFL
jgi:hypothetical protein